MDKYTAGLAAVDHCHEIIALKNALVVAKVRNHGVKGDVDLVSRIEDTIAREMADLSIILDSWIVDPEIRKEREELFRKNGRAVSA